MMAQGMTQEEAEAAMAIQGVMKGKEAREGVKDDLEIINQEEAAAAAKATLFSDKKVNKDRVRRIVTDLDTDGSGQISASEVKTLFGSILKLPVEEIPDDHKEIVAFVGLSIDAMVENLSLSVTKDQIDKYFEERFPAATDSERADAAQQIQATMRGKKTRDRVGGMLVDGSNMPPPDVMRREAAKLTGLVETALPSAKLLSGTSRWLFSMLKNPDDGYVHAEKVMEACLMYDDSVSEDGIIGTLESIEASEKLTEIDLYNWIVLMFGDCSEDEFIGGATDFGEAARLVIFNDLTTSTV